MSLPFDIYFTEDKSLFKDSLNVSILKQTFNDGSGNASGDGSLEKLLVDEITMSQDGSLKIYFNKPIIAPNIEIFSSTNDSGEQTRRLSTYYDQ